MIQFITKQHLVIIDAVVKHYYHVVISMYYFLMNDFRLCSEIKRDDDTGFDIFNPETSAEVDSQFLTSLDVICACIFTKLRKSQEINILILLKKSY